MRCGGGGDLSGDTAETLFDKLLQRPARAVACKHTEIVNMKIGVVVRLRYLIIIYFGKMKNAIKNGIATNNAIFSPDPNPFFTLSVLCAPIFCAV